MRYGVHIRVRGVVQGVGFRPTVARLARAKRLAGWVRNDHEGVLIALAAVESDAADFMEELRGELGPLARIDEVEHEVVDPMFLPDTDFRIVASVDGAPKAAIAPDAAMCPQCDSETRDPYQRRYRYPFTNCTHCGPRYSIVQAIPYDRAHTSMRAFEMCAECAAEYEDEADRRYHAQPIACHTCGPKASLHRMDGRAYSVSRFSMLDEVDAVCSLLMLGEIVAVKGLGGYHLCCDATNEEAVARLRQRKGRMHKPFAMMARDLDVLTTYAHVTEAERDALTSPAAPIVLLSLKEGAEPALAPGVAPDQGELGFMLPYTPLHQMILRRMARPIVCTSGNLTDEPQCIEDGEARERLSGIADWILMHNRPIVNRVDDSVCRLMGGRVRVLRRARGFAPDTTALPPGFEGAPAVLATGSQLKSTFCLVHEGQAVLSPHLGDLDDFSAFTAWQDTLERISALWEHTPSVVAVDTHPQWRAATTGRNIARARGLDLTEVQHHHAHIAACMAEHGLPRRTPPVLGVALDGMGWGEDDTIWGGEFLVADYSGFERAACFKPVAMLGGELASRQPWRNLYAHIMAEMGWAEFSMNYAETEAYRLLEGKPRGVLDQMLASGQGAPLASSVGRLFDAIAAAVGIYPEAIDYEGQAAMALEAAVVPRALEQAKSSAEIYPIGIPRHQELGLPYVEPLGMWRAILGDVWMGVDVGLIAARAHVALAWSVAAMAKKIRKAHPELERCVLSGGVWQNKILTELASERLEADGWSVLTHADVPPNDGGVSLGQAVVACARALEGA
ncbi:MAG: carbamoyltransferase HypF [Myxococcota bacterium]